MHLALLFFALLHPITVIALLALSAAAVHLKTVLLWLAAAASYFMFGTTIAFPGYGSKLASGGTTGRQLYQRGAAEESQFFRYSRLSSMTSQISTRRRSSKSG